MLVLGGINTDYFGQGDALPGPGETRNGQRFLESPGGKGANQAVAAARMGATVTLIGAVGDDDRGRQLLAHLEREHVDVTHVVRLAQLEVPLDCVVSAFHWARRVGAQTILDPTPAMPLSESVVRLVDVIRPNATEADTLTGIRVADRDSARRAAQQLLSRGATHAIVQAGEHGNLVVSRDAEQWLPHLKVVAVDSTGAGDAFAGTLAACFARGDSMTDAAALANAAAALETTALGAQTPRGSEDQLRAIMERGIQQA